MGKWVQLRTAKNIEIGGVTASYGPGDWVEVGKQLALRWIANGDAWAPEETVTADYAENSEVGIYVVGGTSELNTARALLSKTKINMANGPQPELRWPRTMIWEPSVMLRPELMAVGFSLLDVWEVAWPLRSYEKLACDQRGDQERTAKLIGDLRIPVYEVGLGFVRRTETTSLLMEYWIEERVEASDHYLPFLRALYRARPLVLALPTTWVDENAVRASRTEGD